MNFIEDLINLTQGELLVKYWWLWGSIIVTLIIYELIKNKTDKF
jgi:hypothetical protein